jgi:2-polyprenyl-6-methoxyphenol hydroxylase-like FAD-dependent oxidoreductase
VSSFPDRDPSLVVNPNVSPGSEVRLHDAPSLVEKAGLEREVDIAIAGGGLAGSLAAVVLGRAGYRVAVVDMHRVYPPEFRCEKLAGDQLDLLRELGLFDCLTAVGKPIQQMYVARFGKLVDRMNSEEHGFFYEEFVNVVRARFPSNVEFVVGRVADFETGPEHQRVILSSGEVINARLIVLASGLGDALRQKLGIRRRAVRDGHSLSIGFSIAPISGGSFDFPALTYYGERTSERIAYLSLFPAGDDMRGNLFCYRGHDGAWARSVRDRPQETLFGAMPGLSRFIGDFQVVGKVKIRVADLYRAENHYRDGVVLVGDAFQTTCPAAGNGVTRVLTDVGRLCKEHVPRWFATPGMGAEKIGQFYDDPVKRACDARCAWLAEYCRLFAISNGPMWHARRWRAYLRPRLRGWVNRSGIGHTDRGYARRPAMPTKPATKGSASPSERILQPEDSF